MSGSDPRLLKGVAFDALFSSFAATAFRLETRESYNEPNELAAFLSGDPDAVPHDFLEDWYRLVRSHTAAGRQVRRVRIVSEPHSHYTRFGLRVSERNVAVGEDIRYLPRIQAEALGLPDIDYWIFDASRLYVVRFADDGTLLGAEPILNSAPIAQSLTWQEIAWSHGISRAAYFARHASSEDDGS